MSNYLPLSTTADLSSATLEPWIEGACDLIAQKFLAGVSIEEIVADWGLDVNGPDSVPVPRLLLDIFRLQLSRCYKPVSEMGTISRHA